MALIWPGAHAVLMYLRENTPIHEIKRKIANRKMAGCVHRCVFESVSLGYPHMCKKEVKFMLTKPWQRHTIKSRKTVYKTRERRRQRRQGDRGTEGTKNSK